MSFYSVRKKYIFLLGLTMLMIFMTILSHPQKKNIVPNNSFHRVQRSLEIQKKDAIFDSLGVALPDFNMDKIHAVFEQMERVLKEEKTSIILFLSEPIINNHSFEYLHNPENACTDSPTEILVVVPSAPENFEKRKKVRNGDYRKFLNITENETKLVFFIGEPKDNKTQSLIDEESNTYQDIVQESFIDIYHNIRYKAVSMLKWVTTFCSSVKYVIRNDDDIAVNLTSVINAVKRTSFKYSNFILGRLRLNDKPARAKKHKYLLSEREYPEAYFPPYALGGLLGYPILTVELLYEAALRVKPIWLDDVYITGICGQKVGVKLLSDPQFEYKHKPS